MADRNVTTLEYITAMITYLLLAHYFTTYLQISVFYGVEVMEALSLRLLSSTKILMNSLLLVFCGEEGTNKGQY